MDILAVVIIVVAWVIVINWTAKSKIKQYREYDGPEYTGAGSGSIIGLGIGIGALFTAVTVLGLIKLL